MQVYRIARKKWATDRIGEGSRQFGGRWNPVGLAALYASATIELCVFEKRVNLSGLSHPDLCLVSIDIPDKFSLYHRPRLDDLPDDWDAIPVASASQEFGKEWLKSSKHLVMLVPSVIVPEATNAVINPAHPTISEVKMEILRDFHFDRRL